MSLVSVCFIVSLIVDLMVSPRYPWSRKLNQGALLYETMMMEGNPG